MPVSAAGGLPNGFTLSVPPSDFEAESVGVWCARTALTVMRSVTLAGDAKAHHIVAYYNIHGQPVMSNQSCHSIPQPSAAKFLATGSANQRPAKHSVSGDRAVSGVYFWLCCTLLMMKWVLLSAALNTRHSNSCSNII